MLWGCSMQRRYHKNHQKVQPNVCTFYTVSLSPGSIPDGIAVDAISRLLFYTDAGRKLIAVMTLDGSFHKVIVTEGLDHPRAIAADPIRGWVTPTSLSIWWRHVREIISALLALCEGKPPVIDSSHHKGPAMWDSHVFCCCFAWTSCPGTLWHATSLLFCSHIYWTDWGEESRIEKSAMDGSDRRHLVDTGKGGWPNGLTIDELGKYRKVSNIRRTQSQNLNASRLIW